MITSGADEPFLTVAEVAELLKINQQTVRNWIDQGSLPAVRVGRRVRIRRADLDRILAEGYQGPAPAPSVASGPDANDFWSGEPVGVAETAPSATADSAVAITSDRPPGGTDEEGSSGR